MPLVPAKCPECGGNVVVDSEKDAWICEFCKAPFIVEKAINNFNTVNNITNNITADKVIIGVDEGDKREELKEQFEFFKTKLQQTGEGGRELTESADKFYKTVVAERPTDLQCKCEYFNMVWDCCDLLLNGYSTYYPREHMRSKPQSNYRVALYSLRDEIVYLDSTLTEKLDEKIADIENRIYRKITEDDEWNIEESVKQQHLDIENYLFYGYIDSDPSLILVRQYLKGACPEEIKKEIEGIRRVYSHIKSGPHDETHEIFGHVCISNYNRSDLYYFKNPIMSEKDMKEYVEMKNYEYLQDCRKQKICPTCRKHTIFGKCANEYCREYKKKVL